MILTLEILGWRLGGGSQSRLLFLLTLAFTVSQMFSNLIVISFLIEFNLWES